VPIKILVVNNSASDSLIIKSSLSQYSILTASDAVEAMRMLEDHDGINLLILDLSLPDMNSFQILMSLKENERFRKIRTIILTNQDEPENEVKGLNLGAVDYIRKPINIDSLKARIDVHVAILSAEQALEQQLDDQIRTFDVIFNQVPIGIAISHSFDPNDANKNIKIVNSTYEKITGRTKEDLFSLGIAKITHPDDLQEDMNNFKRLVAGEIKMYSMDKRYIKPDGSVVWVNMIVAPLTLSNDQEHNFIYLVQDITERKRIEIALNKSEPSKAVLLSHLPGLAYRCHNDYDWTMQYVSQGCLNLTGYPPESLLYNRDLSFNDIIAPEYRKLLSNEWERILPTKQTFKYEYEIITANGERKWVLEMGQGIYNDAGEVEALEGIVLDISDRKEIEDTLKYNNEHDRRTGLYNRDYLISLLEKDLKSKSISKKALIGINLSMVQLLTANYGFQYSQNLIKNVAEELNKLCTENRLMFHARENRFVFYILNYKDKNELVSFSEIIADTLRSFFLTERIDGGIGILEIDHDENEVDVDMLMRRLVIASERTLSRFGNDFQICFYNEELEELVNRERDIVKALSIIAADQPSNDELYLQYQPILNLKTNLICGFEALARLRTEKFGMVSPLEFIPLAEKTKLILPIGDKVILSALQFLKKLKKHKYDEINIAINISVIQLLQPDFTSKLFELIRDMQINPNNICIEITESVFAFDYEVINHIIETLREAGLHIAIDDFGTGYSSLAREKELKINCLKIDKYFIDKLLSSDLNQAITSDIISMSHKLGHCTIAEGVECESQLQYLKEYDCDKIQGYFISKPLDENDAIDFLKKYNKK
jgi:PAS domain S-box-containing protein